MLKRWQPDQTEQDLSSLVSSRDAIQFLHAESLANGNAAITEILAEALTCGDALIAGEQEISYGSKDALFYMYFLRAILGLPVPKVEHLLELLEWLKIIPPGREAGNDGGLRDRPKTE
jgi:hypothetical protein